MKSSLPLPSINWWALFRKDRAAYCGLWIILFLFVIALTAPFLANNKPLLLCNGSGCSSPLLRAMSHTDWRYLLYGVGGGLIILFRRRFRPKTGLLLVLGLVLVTETFCLVHMPRLDGTDYKTVSASFKLMPPIPYSPYEQGTDQFAQPSVKHLCGTDSLSRDIAARMLHGARTSLTVGFVAEGISLAIGIAIGAIAGYYRKRADLIISRLIEIMECFPTFFLILTVIAFLPPSLFTIMVVIGLTSWTGIARLVRAEFLRLGVQPFTLAALAGGASDLRVMFRHILPNAMGPILVSATFGVAAAILVESSLSFLGFGVPPPDPTWGDILSESRRYIDFAWWLATFPGVAIFVTITSYNLVGEGLRDAIDPRLRV
jgi:peptide/nickel transport system permease protein